MPAQFPRGCGFHPALGPGGPGRTIESEGPGARQANQQRPGFKFRSPRFAGSFRLSGTTRDSTGAALAGCNVELFRISDDVNLAATVSDGAGLFSFTVASNSDTYFIVAFNAANTQAGATVEGLIATPVGT